METYSTLLLYQVLFILSLHNDTVASVFFALLIAVLLPLAPAAAVVVLVVVAIAALYISSTLASTIASSSAGAGLMHGSVMPSTSREPGEMFPNARWNRMVRMMAPMQFLAMDRSQV